MELQTVMEQLRLLGREQIKQIYQNHGAREPLFGVTTGAMKSLIKAIKRDYALSMALYDTGNYDAAYLAGLIADPIAMCPEDLEHWMANAYCPALSDSVVAVTLAKTTFAEELANCWIDSDQELRQSAGWSCYARLLSARLDHSLDEEKLSLMLHRVAKEIHTQPNQTRYSMNNFVIAAGISFLPLHSQALLTAQQIGAVEVDMGNTCCTVPAAFQYIKKAEEKGRLGYKRK